MNTSIESGSIDALHMAANESAKRLSGGMNVESFSSRIPSGARVLHVYPANASLGVVVSRLRTDVYWTNLHRSSAEFEVEKLSQQPANLEVAVGSIDSALGNLQTGFDFIYSLDLLRAAPGKEADSRRNALLNMLNLLSANGALSVGPAKPADEPVGRRYNLQSVKDYPRILKLTRQSFGTAIQSDHPLLEEALDELE